MATDPTDPYAGWKEVPADPYEGWTEVPAEEPTAFEQVKPEAPSTRDYESYLPEKSLGLRETKLSDDDQRIRDIFTHVTTPTTQDGVNKQAAVQQLATETNLPFNTVAERFDEVYARNELAKISPRRWRLENPQLAEFVLNNPASGSFVQKDEGLSKTLRAINAITGFLLPKRETLEKWKKSNEEKDAKIRAFAGKGTFLEDEFRDRTQEESLIPSAEEVAFAPKGPTSYKQDAQSKAVNEDPLGFLKVPFLRRKETLAGINADRLWWEIRNRRLMGKPTAQLESMAHDWELEAQPRDYQQGEVGKVVSSAMTGTTSSLSILPEMGKGAGAGGAIGGTIGFVGGFLEGGPPVATEMGWIGMKTGAELGGAGGAYVGTARLEGGGAYKEFLRTKLDDGSPVDERFAAAGSIIYEHLAAAIEIGLGSVGPVPKLGPAVDLIKSGAKKQAVAALLKNPLFVSATKRFMKSLAHQSLEEAGEEGIQALSKDATDYFMRSAQALGKGEGLEAGKHGMAGAADIGGAIDASVEVVPSVLLQGGVHAGGAHALSAVVNKVRLRNEVTRAKESAGVMAELANLTDSPTAKADPAAVAEALQSGGLRRNVYIDAAAAHAAFTKLAQDANLPVEQVANEFLGEKGAEKLAEGVATGNHVEVPVQQYVKTFSGTKLAQELLPHSTIATDTPTLAQLGAKTQAEIDKAIKDEAEKLAAEFDDGKHAEPESEGEAHYLDVMEKTLARMPRDTADSARQKMNLNRAVQRTLAKRFNTSADELFKGEAMSLEQGLHPQMADILSERAKDEAFRTQGRASELYRDAPTNLPNRAAYEATPRAPGTITGVLAFEGAKWFNDNGNHLITDNIMAAVGAVLHGMGLNPHRVGVGDFAFDVKDEAHLNEIRAKVTPLLPESMRGLQVTGAVGPDLGAASFVLDRHHDSLVGRGERADARPVLRDAEGLPILDKEGNEQVQKPQRPKGLAEGVTPAAIEAEASKIQKATPELAEALRKRAEGLASIDYFNEAYVDPDTGVWTKKAWDAMPRKQHVASLDLSGLRRANLRYSKDVGNRMLFALKFWAQEIGGTLVDFTQFHGDEFGAQSEDPKALEMFVEGLRARLNRIAVPFKDPETDELTYVPLEFHYGFSDEASLEKADAELNERKERLKKARAAGLADRGRAGPVQPASGRVEGKGEGGHPPGGAPAHPASSANAEEVAKEPFVFLAPTTPEGARKDDYAGARAFVGRLRKNNAEGKAWFNWCVDAKGKGTRPVVSWDMESTLARYGVVDPIDGFSGDEAGHDMAAKKMKGKKGGVGPGNKEGVGLVGAARDAWDKRKTEPMSRNLFKQAPDYSTVFYQFPTPEESLARMQEERVFADLMLQRGATPVENVDAIVDQLRRDGEIHRGRWHEFAVWYFPDWGSPHRSTQIFETFEQAERFIRETGDRVVAAAVHANSLPGTEDARLSNREMLERMASQGYAPVSQFDDLPFEEVQPPMAARDGKRGLLDPEGNWHPLDEFPESKNLPNQAGLEGQPTNLSSIMKAGVVVPPGYTGRVVLEQGSSAGPGRKVTLLHQFPTPEQSLEQMHLERVLRELLADSGARAVTKAEIEAALKNPEVRRLSILATLARLVGGLEDEVGGGDLAYATQAVRGDIRHVIDADWRPLAERAELWAMLRSVGGEEALARYILAKANAEAFNETEHAHARPPPGGGRRNDAYAQYGGLRAHDEDAWAEQIALELDNEMLTAGPGDKQRGIPPAADIPASKDLPNQKTLEQNLMHRLWDEEVVVPEGYTGKVNLKASSDEKGQPRGQTEIDPRAEVDAQLKRLFKIVLNPNADHSTFLHESAHVFLHLMTTLAARSDAPQQLRDDYAAILKWLDAKSPDDLEVKSAAEDDPGRVRHEKWARGFERYLMEGKAPAKRLVPMFERFRLWLSKIYRDPRLLRVELSDDIRRVFDRMVATDTEIENYQKAMGLDEPAAADIFDHPDDYEKYLNSRREVTSSVTRRMDLAVAKDRLRENERWWKDELKAERKKATEDYEKLPERIAQQTLAGKGELSGRGTPSIRLARARVAEMVGEPNVKKFLTTKDAEAVDPDEVADFLGFHTGENPDGRRMLQAILALPAKDDWVEKRAQAVMAEKHPDVANDIAKLKDAVAKGLHGSASLEHVMLEWALLKKKLSKPGDKLWEQQQTPIEAIRLAAHNIVAGRTIDRLDVGAALRAERNSADLSAINALKKKYDEAFRYKQKQLLHMFLWMEMTKAKEEREAFYELASRLSKDVDGGRTGRASALGKANPVYREAAASMLEAIGLRQPDENHPGATIEELVAQMEKDGQVVGIDEDVLEQIQVKPRGAKDLTVAEMRAVRDAMASIKAAASGLTTVLKEGKRIDREEAIERLRDEMERNRKHVGPVASSESAETVGEFLSRGWTEFDGSGLRPETLIYMLGGQNQDSEAWKLLMEPLTKAKHTKAARTKELLAPLEKKLEAAFKSGSFMKRIDSNLFEGHREDLQPPKYVYQVFMMALHMGTQSSRDRLTRGRNISEQQVIDAINRHLTPQHLELVQSIWDANESLWPEASALEERLNGIAPPKLEHTPLVTVHGKLKGGYFPAKYDARVEDVGEKQLGDDLAAVLDPTYLPPGTSRSHLKRRAEEFSGALLLEPGLILRHMDQVVHDIAYREALLSVASIVMDPRIKKAMRERLGAGRASQFLPWLKDQGTQAGANLTDVWSRVGRALKKRTVMGALAYRIPTALGDLSNFMIGARRIGVGSMLRGIYSVFKGGDEGIAFAYKHSGELNSRNGQMKERFQSFLSLMTKLGGKARRLLDAFDRHGFTVFEYTERLFSVPAWLGAYHSATKEGKAHDDAVTYADAMIRRMLPAWNPTDQAFIQRARHLSPFLMFASWHSAIYNELRLEWDPVLQSLGVEKGTSTAKKAAIATAASLFIIFSGYVVGELLSGRGPEGGDGDDPEDRILFWLARKMMVGAIMPLPFIGPDVGTAIESKLLHKRTNPRGGIFTSFIDPAIKAGEAMMDGDKDALDKFIAACRAIAPVTGVPTYPLTPLKYGAGLQSGEAAPRGAGDVAGGFVYGQRPGQPANPFTIGQDVAEGVPPGTGPN